MAIRLQGGFTSRKESAVYVFNIHDSSYAGSVIDFDLANDGIVEEYDPEDKGRNQAILTSSMEIRLLVKNSSIETFIEDAANAAEGRFKLEVLKNGNKYWYGYILPDQFTLNDLPYGLNPVLKLRATDGIGRLKDIDYNNAGTAYSGKVTFLAHLFNILGKIDLQDFYGATEDYLVTYVDWWDQNHVYAATSDPYALSRVDHKAFIRVDNSGEIAFSSAYDVLEQIVKAWNCRFLYSAGTYKLVQINAYQTNAATKVLKVYDKNQGVTTTSTSDLAIWNKTTGLLSNFQSGDRDAFHNKGNYKYYPALRETQVEYEHFGTENLIPGETWTQSTAQTATYNDVDFNDGAAALSFSAIVSYRANWTTESELQVMTYWFQIRIQVGNYYLRRNYTVNGGKITPGVVEWTTTPSYYNYFPWQYMYTNNNLYSIPVGFDTPPLPEGGELNVIITRAGAYNGSGEQVFISTSDFTPYYTWSNVSVSILVDGNLEDQTTTIAYNASNDDGSTNSKVETVKLLVGDGPTLNTFGAIEVYDSSAWVESTGWRKNNSGSYIAFGQLLANELLAGQKVAIKRYFGEVTGSYNAHDRLRRYGGASIVNFVFIGGRHSLHEDRWNGEWFIIDVDSLGITEKPIRRFSGPTRFRPDRLGFEDFGTINPNVVTQFETEVPIHTFDPEDESPTQIPISEQIPADVEIATIPIDALENDDYIFAGDELEIITPTGEVINVVVTEDAAPGDTSISIVPITPGIDIPEGSSLSIPLTDLYAYIQTSRKKELRFFDVLRASDAIVDGNAIYFFRIDESSKMYLNRAVGMELQVYTPGGGGGQYSCLFKHDGSTISTLTVSETVELARSTFDFSLINGLYTFHIASITGTTPVGVNILLNYIEPLQKQVFIDPNATINGAYPGDPEAYAAGVKVNEMYNMSLDNYHGMPFGLVILNYATTTYPSDSAAPVSADQWYAVSAGNVYGAKVGSIRVKGYTGTSYANDTAAAGGGIAVGEYYVLSAANPYGVAGGFVKLRKS